MKKKKRASRSYSRLMIFTVLSFVIIAVGMTSYNLYLDGGCTRMYKEIEMISDIYRSQTERHLVVIDKQINSDNVLIKITSYWIITVILKSHIVMIDVKNYLASLKKSLTSTYRQLHDTS